MRLTDTANDIIEPTSPTQTGAAFVLSIVENLKDVVFQTDREGRWTFLNPAWTELTGLPVARSIGASFLKYVLPEDREQNRQLFLPLIEQRQEYCSHEVCYRNRTGGYRWISVYAHLMRGEDGAVIGTAGTLTDVTERRFTEERLRESEARKTTILESAMDSIITMDHEGRVTEFNPAAERMFGWTRSEAMGCLLTDLIIPERYREAHRRGLAHYLASGEGPVLGKRIEIEACHADGTEFPIELSISVASLHDCPFFTAYLRDISERRQAEQRLQLSQTRLATLIANFQAGILVEDENRKILLTNQPFCDLFSIPAPPVAMVGHNCSNSAEQSKHLFADPETFVERIGTLLSERSVATDEEIRMYDGQVLERDYIPIIVDDVYRGHLWMYRNVTGRYQLTEELKRSNKSLQEFASIASHDLQEPLRKIQAFGGRLKAKLTAAPQLAPECVDYLDRMLNAAARMQTLIDGLLRFSRITTQKRPLQATNLNEIIHDVLNDLEERIHENEASIHVDTLPTIEADPLQMRQLFQNLLGNALKFRSPLRTPVISVQTTTAPGRASGRAQITVADNGIGFEERYATRIFEVFERLHSRQEYEGTGIGLALCRRIVERHGGNIVAHSVLGEGTSFVLEMTGTVQTPTRQEEKQQA